MKYKIEIIAEIQPDETIGLKEEIAEKLSNMDIIFTSVSAVPYTQMKLGEKDK